jgi:hypothetical protein
VPDLPPLTPSSGGMPNRFGLAPPPLQACEELEGRAMAQALVGLRPQEVQAGILQQTRKSGRY